MRNTVNILHLSDFHISSQNKDKFSALCENINDALKNKEIDNYPQVVLVTGDFTEEGNADQFKWFKEGFKGMLSLAYFCCNVLRRLIKLLHLTINCLMLKGLQI